MGNVNHVSGAGVLLGGGFVVLWILVFLPLLILYVWSIIWAYKDAEARGGTGILVALLVALLSWPLGLLIWVIFRPKEAEDSVVETRNKRAIFIPCPCGRQIPVAEHEAGIKITCAACRNEIIVPELSQLKELGCNWKRAAPSVR
jgi:hypothetical protein